jgi:hypothetical protein
MRPSGPAGRCRRANTQRQKAHLNQQMTHTLCRVTRNRWQKSKMIRYVNLMDQFDTLAHFWLLVFLLLRKLSFDCKKQ